LSIISYVTVNIFLNFFYIANTMLLSVFHVLVLDFLVYSAWMDLQNRQP
jgi:hypothetical protein